MIKKLSILTIPLLLLGGYSVAAQAQTYSPDQAQTLQQLSPEQIRMLRQLTPEQRRQLFDQLERQAAQPARQQPGLTEPRIVLPRDVGRARPFPGEQFPEIPRIEEDTTILIEIGELDTLREREPPPAQEGAPQRLEEPRADRETERRRIERRRIERLQIERRRAERRPALPGEPEEKLIPEALLGSHVLKVDKDGFVSLPLIDKVPLAGLTPEQAQKLLNAQPRLTDADIRVTLLPLKPTGPKGLEPFGYDLFAGYPTTFAPATDIPVPPDYVIGPGDTVQVQLFGKENVEYSLVVTRDGTLQFPGIGPVAVMGLSFDELKATLQERLREQMIGVSASITMGPLRSIRVFVLGEAQQPGSYTVSALSTLTNALFVSGGIKTIGSLRDIQLKRKGRVVARMDLYDLLLKGDTSDDVRLMPGDVIFIPPIGQTVGVAGEVRRPAIYELKTEKTVAEVLRLAGGLLPDAYPQATQLERIDDNYERTLVNIDLTQAPSRARAVREGDVVRVYSVLDKMENIIALAGHVERPGPQQWRDGMRLSDLIPSAEVLKPRADLDYLLIRRERPPDRRVDVFSADLTAAWAVPGTSVDPLLHPRDQVLVFSFTDARQDLIEPLIDELEAQATRQDPARQVSVGGRVRAPGVYPLEQNMRVSDLIRAAGQLQEAAYALSAELTRFQVINGEYRETAHIEVNLPAALQSDPRANLLLQPHDFLNIKEVPQWSERREVIISGEVRFPGTYPIQEGETLSQLMRRAGGLTDFAFPEGAVFTRVELRQREQEQLDQLARRLESDLAAVSLEQIQESPDKAQAFTLTRSLLSQLKATEAAGRLVIDLEQTLTGDPVADIVLKHGDHLHVPKQSQEVTVLGEVQHTTSHLYDPDLARDDYIDLSGGTTYKADERRIYVVRANGRVLASGRSLWFARSQGSDIRPGDTIVVPLDADRIRPLTLVSSVSQILYQLALTAAAAQTVGLF